MSYPLSVIRVTAPSTPTASVIIVHGLGDSGAGWTFLSDYFHKKEEYKHINFIFPNAPIKPLAVMGNQQTSQWFNIFEFGNPNAKQDDDGFWKSCELIEDLVSTEVENGIPANRVAVGGFSQGGVVSLGLAASAKEKLAGFVVMSGIFAMSKDVAKHETDVNKNTPIFHGHGDLDPVFNVQYARDTAALFKKWGFSDYQYHEYTGMVHTTCPEELTDIANFLKKVVPA